MPGEAEAADSGAAVDFMAAVCVPVASTAVREVMRGVDTEAERATPVADVMQVADMAIAGPVITAAVIIAEQDGEQQLVRRRSVPRRQGPTAITIVVAAATPTAMAPGFARDKLGMVTRGTG
jgi:hypothetical protein